MEYFVQQIMNAFAFGAEYALLALGLAIVFSIMGLVNFAHGEMIAVGGYTMVAAAALAVRDGGGHARDVARDGAPGGGWGDQENWHLQLQRERARGVRGARASRPDPRLHHHRPTPAAPRWRRVRADRRSPR